MSKNKFSDEIINQTKLACDLLEKAKPIITYKKLVIAENSQFEEYEKLTGKTIPLDYRYWLSKYGSGRIEFSEGELLIPSIHELLANDISAHESDYPDNSSARIVLEWYAPVPGFLALDTLMTDISGCTPDFDS